MAVTPDSIRQHFPEFTDPVKYPDGTINFWLGIAAILVANTRRWVTLLDHGQELFVCHHLVLAAQNVNSASRGNPPGVSKGATTSQSVHDVAESYDAAGAAELNAGHWNLTTYGTQYIGLARMIGSGGVQLGGWCG